MDNFESVDYHNNLSSENCWPHNLQYRPTVI